MNQAGKDKAERSLAGKLLATAGSSWLRIIVFFAVSFILTPILIQELGLDLFGVFMLVAVSMALAGPLRGAIRKTITRELTQAYTSDDPERFQKTFSNGVCLGAWGALIGLALTAVLAFGAPYVLQVAPEHRFRLGLAVAFEGLLLVEIFALMAWHNLYFAAHRFVEENAHRALNRLLDLVSILLAMWIEPEHIFISFVSIRFGLHTLHHLGKAWRIATLVPTARFKRSLIDGKEIKEMAAVGGWSTANQIARLGFYQADRIIVALFRLPGFGGSRSSAARYVGMFGRSSFTAPTAIFGGPCTRKGNQTHRPGCRCSRCGSSGDGGLLSRHRRG